MKKIHINRAGTALGQFTTAEVDAGLKSGEFLPTDLGWREGMAEWKPLGQWADLDPAPVAEGLVLPEPVPERDGPDWEHREQLSLVPAIVGTVKAFLLNPAEAFANMRTMGGLGQPLFYYFLLSYVGMLIAIGMNMLLQMAGAGIAGNRTGMITSMTELAAYVFLMPIVLVVSLYLYAAILQFSLWVTGAGGIPYETIFRVAAYATGSTAVFSVVPICGGFIGSIWGLILVIIGLTKVSNITMGKAVVVVLLPVIVFCAIGSLAAGLAISLFGFGK